MRTRDDLGAADVTDEQLAEMVADLLHEDEVELLDVEVAPVDYDLPAITTAGRWWVSGHVASHAATSDVTPSGTVPFRIFVKQVQSWSRSPYFQYVPEEFREIAAAMVPWRTEAEVYRSDLHDRLPDGLSLPRALGVFDLDAESASIWLDEVPVRPATWDIARYERAAYLLGRLAASPRVAPLAGLRDVDWTLTAYATGRLGIQVIPMLMDDGIWQHPLCAAYDDELRDRLRTAAGDSFALAAEADALPRLTSHGDACPNNLLAADPAADEDFVMIDFGFWGGNPVGFDLTQLLVGDVQIGRRSAEGLAELDDAILTAYVDGLRAEGCEIPEAQVRRGHALCLLLMSGLSTVPFDLFDGPVDDRTLSVAADRAAIARYSLDLLESTADRSEELKAAGSGSGSTWASG